MILEVGTLLTLTRHRRQLVRVTEQHDLHPAECLVLSLPGLPQRPVDRIEQVGVDHGDLVDDESVDSAEQFAQLDALVDVVVGDDADRQSEEGVDGLPAHVQRRDTGGRTDHDLLRRVLGEVIQEGGFTGSRPTCDEQVLLGGLDRVEDRLLFRRQLQLVPPDTVHRFTVPGASRAWCQRAGTVQNATALRMRNLGWDS